MRTILRLPLFVWRIAVVLALCIVILSFFLLTKQHAQSSYEPAIYDCTYVHKRNICRLYDPISKKHFLIILGDFGSSAIVENEGGRQ